jgi:hypothetical protein
MTSNDSIHRILPGHLFIIVEINFQTRRWLSDTQVTLNPLMAYSREYTASVERTRVRRRHLVALPVTSLLQI